MHISPFRASIAEKSIVLSHPGFFREVKEDYRSLKTDHCFHTQKKPAFWIYQIQQSFRTHTGILACADLNDFFEKRIRPHEKTLVDKEAKQREILEKRQASVKPVLLLYRDIKAINEWIHEKIEARGPDHTYVIAWQEEVHLFWMVADQEECQKLVQLFREQVPRIYIADGHHRTAATVHWQSTMSNTPTDKLYAAFFAGSEIDIKAFNRIVDLPEDWPLETFLSKLYSYFHLKPLKQGRLPIHKRQLCLYGYDRWFELSWKQHCLKASQEAVLLDVSLLNDLIFKECLGITNIRDNPSIEYLESPRGLESIGELVRKGGNKAGFCLYPVDLDDFFDLADKQIMLPPKSTWFQPRLRNGLLVLDFNEQS